MQSLSKKIFCFVLSLSLLSGCGTSEEQQKSGMETQLEITAQTETVAAADSETEAEPETVTKEQVTLEQGITIQKSSKQLSNDMANKAFEVIKEQISSSNEGINKCENFELVISSEQKKDGLIWEKLWVYYDLIPVREPEENPFLLGMKEARDALSDTEQIAWADKEIEGWYQELAGNYRQQKEEPNMWMQMWLVYDSEGEDYTIYCETKPDGHYQLVTLEEYMEQHTEDYELEMKKGREYIMEAV